MPCGRENRLMGARVGYPVMDTSWVVCAWMREVVNFSYCVRVSFQSIIIVYLGYETDLSDERRQTEDISY